MGSSRLALKRHLDRKLKVYREKAKFLSKARGARLYTRLLLYTLLLIPQERKVPGLLNVWRPPLGALAGLFWKRYRPECHAELLEQAFRMMTFTRVALADGGWWTPLVVRGFPDMDRPDDRVTIEVELPAGSGHGPALDFDALVEYGRISDPAFDLWMGLAYLWDRQKRLNAGYRIHARRPKAWRNDRGHLLRQDGTVVLGKPGGPIVDEEKGKLFWPAGRRPVTDWRHPEAVIEGLERHPQADRLPYLTPESRRQLAYGFNTRAIHKGTDLRERQTADRLLERFEADGRVVIERDGPDWRVLEVFPEADFRRSVNSGFLEPRLLE